MATVSHRARSGRRVSSAALRRLRDPLLLFVVPVAFALLEHRARVRRLVADRLRLPRNALGACPRAPRRRADLSGADARRDGHREPGGLPAARSSSLSVPLALLPVDGRVVALVLPARRRACFARAVDPRRPRLALPRPRASRRRSWSTACSSGTSRSLLVLPLALAWRYRDSARVAGLAVGVAVAAKLFVWPLVVWLLLTRRFRAAAWAVGSAAVLVLGAWALIGFEGFADYPALLRAVQDVYAVRSISLSTVAGGARCVGLRRGRRRRGSRASRASRSPRGSSRRADGDRRAFALVVAACIVASPIVWPNYAALLFVPIAITWPRLSRRPGSSGTSSGSSARSRRSRTCRRSAAGRRTCPSRPGRGAIRSPCSGTRPGTMLVVGGVALALAMVVRSRHAVERPAEAATP